MARDLTPKQQRFVEEYLVDLNATQAAIRAGYSVRTANEQGARLLAKASVQEAVVIAQKARSERTEITQDAVLQQLWGVACADPGKLIEFRRSCCRFCWGEGNRWQRTRGEYEADRESLAKVNEERVAAGKEPFVFDEKGGVGYDKRKPPNADCQECFGEGIGYTFVHDTRNLTAEAKLLYAGVKETKEGIEVKMHSPMDARQMIGRHLGMFKDKVEHSNPDGTLRPQVIKIVPAPANAR